MLKLVYGKAILTVMLVSLYTGLLCKVAVSRNSSSVQWIKTHKYHRLRFVPRSSSKLISIPPITTYHTSSH
jgi:hypothetical protein